MHRKHSHADEWSASPDRSETLTYQASQASCFFGSSAFPARHARAVIATPNTRYTWEIAQESQTAARQIGDQEHMLVLASFRLLKPGLIGDAAPQTCGRRIKWGWIDKGRGVGWRWVAAGRCEGLGGHAPVGSAVFDTGERWVDGGPVSLFAVVLGERDGVAVELDGERRGARP